MCEYTEEEVRMKRIMIEHSNRIFLLIEADKFGISKFFRSECLNRISDVITDRALPEKYQILFEKYNIQLHVLENLK